MSTEPKGLMRLVRAQLAYRDRFGVLPEMDDTDRDLSAQGARVEEALRTGVRLPGDSLKQRAPSAADGDASAPR